MLKFWFKGDTVCLLQDRISLSVFDKLKDLLLCLNSCEMTALLGVLCLPVITPADLQLCRETRTIKKTTGETVFSGDQISSIEYVSCL